MTDCEKSGKQYSSKEPQKNMKCFGVAKSRNQKKSMKKCKCLKEIKEHIRRWKDLPCSRISRIT